MFQIEIKAKLIKNKNEVLDIRLWSCSCGPEHHAKIRMCVGLLASREKNLFVAGPSNKDLLTKSGASFRQIFFSYGLVQLGGVGSRTMGRKIVMKTWGDGEKRQPLKESKYQGFSKNTMPSRSPFRPKSDISLLLAYLDKFSPRDCNFEKLLAIPGEPVVIKTKANGDIIPTYKRAQGRLLTKISF